MREYLLLRYLAERAGAVVSRRELITAIWGGDGGSSNTLATHILRLRRRLERNEAKPQWIRPFAGSDTSSQFQSVVGGGARARRARRQHSTAGMLQASRVKLGAAVRRDVARDE